MEESRFFTEYTVLTEDKDYQKYVRQLLADYWKYISLKMTGEDGEVAAAYTDYPVHLDEDYAESLEEQKEEWFQEAAEKAKGQKLCENVELALELDTPQLYEAWLRGPIVLFVPVQKNTQIQFHTVLRFLFPFTDQMCGAPVIYCNLIRHIFFSLFQKFQQFSD